MGLKVTEAAPLLVMAAAGTTAKWLVDGGLVTSASSYNGLDTASAPSRYSEEIPYQSHTVVNRRSVVLDYYDPRHPMMQAAGLLSCWGPLQIMHSQHEL
jgi:hypothetical protein